MVGCADAQVNGLALPCLAGSCCIGVGRVGCAHISREVLTNGFGLTIEVKYSRTHARVAHDYIRLEADAESSSDG